LLAQETGLYCGPFTRVFWEKVVAQDLIGIAIGAFVIFVGYINILNIQRARKTGIIYAQGTPYDRHKNPKLYLMTFAISFIVAIALPVIGLGIMGAGIFFMAHGL